MNNIVALIPSPLTGPLVWAPVSRVIRRHGVDTRIATPDDGEDSLLPYWARHAVSVARWLHGLSPPGAVILVGHSGAGPLLPAIGAFSPHPVAGYVFVDAGLPIPGQSRLDEMMASLPEIGQELADRLAAGGRFPEWTEEEAREIIPDEGLRRGILAELRPRSQGFFTESLPSVAGWPDAPCAYVKLSAAYSEPAKYAQKRGWLYREFDAGHFHMLVDPEAVAAAILDVTGSMDVAT